MLGAIENGKVEAVRFLLDNGANPDGGRSSGRRGGNPLITAIKTHQPKMAELLIAAGADPRMSVRGIDAIQAAERAGHHALAERLRETPAR